MTYQIIAERENSLLVYEDGKTKIYTNDTYNLLKFKEFNGERIILHTKSKLDDEITKIYVQETYDRGIFNVQYNKETLQIRDCIQMSKAIDEYLKTDSNKKIKELFLRKYMEANRVKIMKLMAKSFTEKVHVNTDGNFIIHNIFMVDTKGSSYYKSSSKLQRGQQKLHKDKRWNYLCIVPKGKLRRFKIKTDIGEVELSTLDVEIMSKVGFLLYPDLTDSIFMSQLPQVWKNLLHKLAKEK